MPFLEGFSTGLRNSRLFVPFLSRGALAPIAKLNETSPCDNVLLEYQFALELRKRGLLPLGIYPIFLGDINVVEGAGEIRKEYFRSGCHPTVPDIVVRSVEDALEEQLDRMGLRGGAVTKGWTAKQIVDGITENQGFLKSGNAESLTNESVSSIVEILNSAVPRWTRFKKRHSQKLIALAVALLLAVVLAIVMGAPGAASGDAAASSTESFSVQSTIQLASEPSDAQVEQIDNQLEADLDLPDDQVIVTKSSQKNNGFLGNAGGHERASILAKSATIHTLVIRVLGLSSQSEATNAAGRIDSESEVQHLLDRAVGPNALDATRVSTMSVSSGGSPCSSATMTSGGSTVTFDSSIPHGGDLHVVDGCDDPGFSGTPVLFCNDGVTTVTADPCVAVPCPANTAGTVPGTSGRGGASGCAVNAGHRGEVTATTVDPFYDDSTIEAVDCPAMTTGTSVPAGCAPVPGYAGSVTATNADPDYFDSNVSICLPGTFSLAAASFCSECGQDNLYSPASGQTECFSCPGNKYTSGGSGSTTRTSCDACPEGQVCDGTSVRTDCSAGTFALLGASACTVCPGGQYADEEGRGGCKLCGAGKFLADGGDAADHDSEADCQDCGEGSSTSGQEGAMSCNGCSGGTYASTGSQTCQVCSAGTYSLDDATVCLECGETRYSSTAGLSECQLCPSTSYTSGGSGDATRTSCDPCPAGQSCDGTSVKSNCTLGTFSELGSGLCSVCDNGAYADEPGLGTCKPCPEGKYLNDGGTVTIGEHDEESDCLMCTYGQGSLEGSSSCSIATCNDGNVSTIFDGTLNCTCNQGYRGGGYYVAGSVTFPACNPLIISCGDFGGACAACLGNGGQACSRDENRAGDVGACDGDTAGGKCVDLAPFASDTEAHALTVFYLSVDKPGWVGSSSSGKCGWQGVTCSNGQVTQL